MLTPEQKKGYLQNPNYCPNCGSPDISSGHMEADCSSAWCDVECESCEATWQDVYELVDIDNFEPPASEDEAPSE